MKEQDLFDMGFTFIMQGLNTSNDEHERWYRLDVDNHHYIKVYIFLEAFKSGRITSIELNDVDVEDTQGNYREMNNFPYSWMHNIKVQNKEDIELAIKLLWGKQRKKTQ